MAHRPDISYQFDPLQRQSETQKSVVKQDPMVPHNMKGRDLIRATDFNFLMVLGKGSFGKVKREKVKAKNGTLKEGEFELCVA